MKYLIYNDMPSKLEQLKKEIQRLRPEILNLEFGCEIDRGANLKCKEFVAGIFGDKISIVRIDKKIGSYLPFEVSRELFENWTILGRPITLEDVLAVLYLDDEDYIPDVDVGWKKGIGECFLFTFNEKMYVWEYGKPLDDQSEETINFLHSLIVK